MDMPVSRLEARNLEKTYGSRTVVHLSLIHISEPTRPY